LAYGDNTLVYPERWLRMGNPILHRLNYSGKGDGKLEKGENPKRVG
jgi:hypothetical protein